MGLEQQIRAYVDENLLVLIEGADYDDETSLIGAGLIDSVGVAELVTYVQSAFGITVGQQEITLGNFDSIKHIASLVRRLSGKTELCSAG
jgi:acyl carrier protein